MKTRTYMLLTLLLAGAIVSNGSAAPANQEKKGETNNRFQKATKDPDATPPRETAHPRRLLVMPRKGSRPTHQKVLEDLDKLHASHNAKVIRKFARFNDLQVVEFPKEAKLDEVLKKYRNSDVVEYAEPDYVREAYAVPNDPLFGSQWGLHNTGQSGLANHPPPPETVPGVVDADIDGPEAWNIRTSANPVIVAVIDTGVRYTHEDLQANMWVNPGEIPNNGIDDDGNGYVDDVYGINAIAHTGDPMDDPAIGHGTHVAGIIGAVGDNGKGIAGVAWQAKIMACKFLGDGGGYDSQAIECINYAIAKGASIINASWGGAPYSQALLTGIEGARSAGIIFVVAAGNSAADMDKIVFYPSGFWLDNIVSVAATTRTDDLAYFSNFGRHQVDIGAPGFEIISTGTNTDTSYITFSGTSMAAPHVAGALALIRAQMPSGSYRQTIYKMYESVDYPAALNGKVLTGGRLNIQRALATASITSPANNNFANAAQLPLDSVSFVRFGSNVGADKESGEPNHAGNAGGKSAWWTWRAPTYGRVRITTAGSTFDTLLAVYTGSSLSGLTLVAANDDSNYGDDGSTTSYVTFTAAAGATFQIAVDGKDGASGGIKLDVAYAPDNDDFQTSWKITGAYIGVLADNFGATKEASEPAHAGIAGGKSAWWSWEAPISGTVSLSTERSSFDTILAVYTGGSLSTLTPVASNNDDSQGDHGGKTSRLSFTAVAGTVYHIAVDGVNGASGLIELTGGYQFSFQLIDSQSRACCDLTDDGFVPGTITIGNDYPPVWHAGWWNNSDWVDLGIPDSTAAALNNAHVIGGQKYVFPYRMVPGSSWEYLWGSTEYTDQATVEKINEAGAIVGGVGSYVYNHPPWIDYLARPYYWTAAAGRIEGGTFGGIGACGAFDVNEEGLAVGYATDAAEIRRAFLWRPGSGGLRDLNFERSATAVAINNHGQIVGWFSTGAGTHAFLWQGGTVKDLGTWGRNGGLPPAGAVPYDISDGGDIVGYAGRYPSTSLFPFPKAFICPKGGLMTDLNLLVNSAPALNYAFALNGRGQVLCSSFSSTFILTPPTKLHLENPQRLGNGSFQFSVTGADGYYYVETSSDLYSWAAKGVATVSGGTGSFLDATASSSTARYYRARSGSTFSVNAVGFMEKSLAAGYSMIANPLDASDNRIPALFANTPEVVEFRKYNRKTGDWDIYEKNGLIWADDQQALPPGDGAMVYATDATTLTFVGELMQGQLRLDIPAGLSVIGALLPQEFPAAEVILGFKPLQETVYRWENLFGAYWVYQYADYAWEPAAPPLFKGESVFVSTPTPRVYERFFSVWQYAASSDSDGDGLADTWELDVFGDLSHSGATQPASRIANASSPTTFSFDTVSGPGTPTYQWRFNGNNITGATGPSYTINSPQSADVGAYDVVVTSSGTTVTSPAAQLALITTQPTNKITGAGISVTFSTAATGTGPFTYQWQRDGNAIPNATNSSYLFAAQAGNAGSYNVVVSRNGYTSGTSQSAQLSVVTQGPQSQQVNAGSTVQFQVTLAGAPPSMIYRWKKNNVPIEDGGNVSGSSTPTLQIANVSSSDAALYRVFLTNAPAAYAPLAGRLSLNVPPSIAVQPRSKSANPGNAVTFTVAASGTTPLTYQWRKNGANISGATASTLTLANISAGDAGNYSVVVNNVTGMPATSSDAALTVVSVPAWSLANSTLGTTPIGIVYAHLEQPDGKILVGNGFGILRLAADGSQDTTFSSPISGSVLSVAQGLNGEIYAGGSFSYSYYDYDEEGNPINYYSIQNLVRLNGDGSIDWSFQPQPDGPVYALAVQTDGNLIAAGDFLGASTYYPTRRVTRFLVGSYGYVDTSFHAQNIGFDGLVRALLLQSDGKIIVGGDFNYFDDGSYSGITQTRLARLYSDGSLDYSYYALYPGGNVYSLAMQADGKVLAGGALAENEYFPGTHNGIVRITTGQNQNGILDTTFNPGVGANGSVNRVLLDATGKIYLVGAFTSVDAVTRGGIARVNSDGSLDANLNPGGGVGGTNPIIYTISRSSDGTFIISGDFTSYNGTARYGIARLAAP